MSKAYPLVKQVRIKNILDKNLAAILEIEQAQAFDQYISITPQYA